MTKNALLLMYLHVVTTKQGILSGKSIGGLDRLPHRASSTRGESGQKISGVKGEYLGNKRALLSVLKELPNRGYFWPLEFVVAWYLESIKRQQKHIDVMRRDDNLKFINRLVFLMITLHLVQNVYISGGQ